MSIEQAIIVMEMMKDEKITPVRKEAIETAIKYLKKGRETGDVVKCADCKYSDEFSKCSFVTFWNRAGDFCSRGDKR